MISLSPLKKKISLSNFLQQPLATLHLTPPLCSDHLLDPPPLLLLPYLLLPSFLIAAVAPRIYCPSLLLLSLHPTFFFS